MNRTRIFLLISFLAACEGNIGDDATPDDGIEAPEVMEPTRDGDPARLEENAPAELRRLSRDELRRSFELLFDFSPPALGSLPDSGSSFANVPGSGGQSVNAVWLETYETALDELIAAVALTLPADCAGECVRELLTRVGPSALRRPLTDIERWVAIYEGADSHEDGLHALFHRLFESPEFIFVIEGLDIRETSVAMVDEYGFAARLSFGLCQHVPDEALMGAARDGLLSTSEGRRSEARRLLTECGEFSLQHFLGQWLGLYTVASTSSEVIDDDDLTQDYIDGADAEWRALIAEVLTRDGSFRDLIAGDFTVADERLQAAYPSVPLDATSRRVNLPASRRGLLNTPAFFLAMASETDTNPFKRGAHIYEHLLCYELPPPPDDILPPPPSGSSRRDVWEEHTSAPTCASCHQHINPIGFVLEDFNSLGVHRTSYSDLDYADSRVDAASDIRRAGLYDLNGGASFSEAMADAAAFRSCFARAWFEYATGRLHRASDDEEAVEALSESLIGQSLVDALASLATSPAFSTRRILGDAQ